MVWAIPISLATTLGITIVFYSSGYLDVSVHQVCFLYRMINLQLIGFPHSEISGLKVICTSPKLIAACHVLHRLREPRHPPYALNNFVNIKYIYSLQQYVKELYKWRISDSNRWPLACKASALANWANPPFKVVSGRLELPTSTLSV